MAVGPQLRSMTDMLLLLIICFAGDESGGFRKPKRTSLSGSSVDEAALAEITTRRNDAGLQDSPGWHLAARGLGHCDGYSRGPVDATQCNFAGMELLRKLGRTPGRSIHVGEGPGLPFGCTIQSGGDWTIHYNPHHNDRTGVRTYQFVCSGEAPTPVATSGNRCVQPEGRRRQSDGYHYRHECQCGSVCVLDAITTQSGSSMLLERGAIDSMDPCDMCNTGAPTCFKPSDHTCFIAPTCPQKQMAVKIQEGVSRRRQGYHRGLHCRKFSIEGRWATNRTFGRNSSYNITYGMSKKKTNFDFASGSSRVQNFDFESAYEAFQIAVQLGFVYEGVGEGSIEVGQQTAQATAAATSTDFAKAFAQYEYTEDSSSFSFQKSESFTNQDGANIYFWTWTMKFLEKTLPDIIIKPANWVQADLPPRCFPDQQVERDYSSCREGGCLPGKEKEGGCEASVPGGPIGANPNYLGCYSTQELVGKAPRQIFSSVKTCRQKCAGFLVFWLQKGGECWCGPEWENLLDQMHDDKWCDLPCQGMQYEKCGGHLLNGSQVSSVYSVDKY